MNRLTQPNLEPTPEFADAGLRVQGAPQIALELEILRHAPRLPSAVSALADLKGVVLLAGAVGPSAFRSGLDRAIVELPLEKYRTVLAHWRDHCAGLAQLIEIQHLPVRLLVDHTSQLPSVSHQPDSSTQLSVERDPSELRGTGGLLRDIAQGYRDDDWLLVANAVQVLWTPLALLATDLAEQSAPVAVVSHSEGTPSGIMLVRCGCLRDIPDIGFVDMKEQGLGIVARRHTVKVLERTEPTAYPIRTYVNYLTALRRYHSG